MLLLRVWAAVLILMSLAIFPMYAAGEKEEEGPPPLSTNWAESDSNEGIAILNQFVKGGHKKAFTSNW